MRKLPADIVKLLKEIPLRDKRRASIINQMNWRLDHGQTFTALDIAKTAKFRTSAKFVACVADSLILLGYIEEIPKGGYGPTAKHKSGCEAMVRNIIKKTGGLSRRALWLGIEARLSEQDVDRLLRRMINSGEIERFATGVYCFPQEVRLYA